jgi:HTH-type transcriptional regulator/antitoxin HigA
MSTTTGILPSYTRLIRQFVLRPIRSKADYERASAILDKLAVRDESTLDAGEADYFETLSLLIEAYDREHYPMPVKGASPLGTLRFLMAQNGMKQIDLAKLLGIGRSAVSMLLAGNRPITADHARRLAERFSVDAGLFL